MKPSKAFRDTITFCSGIILLGCLIQAAGWMRDDRLVFPDVVEILRAFFHLLGERQTYLKIGVTLRHLVEVMAVSALAGIAIGLAEGLSSTVRTLLKPAMILLRSIPMIVMVVIIMVLTRYDRVPLIASSLFVIPIISEASAEGCRSIEPELIDVYRLNSGFNLQVLIHVHLPLIAGYLRQAYANAVGMGLKLVVTTEYLVQTKNSLGKAVYSSSYFNEYQEIYAYALIMIALVLLVGALPFLCAGLKRLLSGSALPPADSESGR